MRGYRTAALVAVFFVFGESLGPDSTGAQEVHHHHGESRAVDEFISRWKMPRDRTRSCCSRVDCAPAEARLINGQWWAKRANDDKWRMVPPGDVEHEQDSPDGRNYLCASNYGPDVYCFIAGAGG